MCLNTSPRNGNLLRAACFDTFHGYRADGKKHWALSFIRDWWKSRHDRVFQTPDGFYTGIGNGRIVHIKY